MRATLCGALMVLLASTASVRQVQSQERAVKPETARAPASATAASGGNSPSDWRRQVSGILERNKQYPPGAQQKGEQGTAVVAFTFNRQGKVTSAHITRSSGSAALDEQTLALVHGVSFPPPPPEMNDRSLVIAVKYKLERSPCDSFGFYGYVFCHLVKPTQPLSPATLTANAGAAADSTKGFITAFRDHLKTCSTLPAGVNVTRPK
jgi:TonB family protein